MSQKPNLNTVRNQFLKKIHSAEKIYECSTNLKQKHLLHPTQAHKIIELAFLSMVGSWEEFLGASFMRYLCASKSPSGFTPPINQGMKQPSLKTAFKTLFKELKGWEPTLGRDYLSLTNIDKVTKAAKRFFVNGEPYSQTLTEYKSQLGIAQKARNRIAHDSEHCKKEFNHVVKEMRGTLRSGYSVGLFLLGSPQPVFLPATEEAHQTDLFTAYANLYAKLALEIAP